MDFLKAVSLVVVVLLVLSLEPLSIAQAQTTDYTVSFLLYNHPDGDLTYELNITISQSSLPILHHAESCPLFKQ